ncbi:TetR family transcriptional regulator [Ruania suaedae]|uniref:TetR/AcrR family transcriptional regulator n=1 Tax=Ruania suaedae TaxID=2897774 RepID=UPI001E5F3034|nr:TetR/AcrR family transcriptional regulator [Ruania suaedae]UFU02189.1 TetR family transcriptional regulator [Ruania suaedae]
MTPTSRTPTREHLLAVAVETFGSDGFEASIRTIAARAGVAVGLVQYHFGGKAGLREQCDRLVYTVIDEAVPRHFHPDRLAAMDRDDPVLVAPFVDYTFRSLALGTPLAHQIVTRLSAHVLYLIGTGSPEDVSRARQIVRHALGATLLDFTAKRPRTKDEAHAFVRAAWEQEFVPLLSAHPCAA